MLLILVQHLDETRARVGRGSSDRLVVHLVAPPDADIQVPRARGREDLGLALDPRARRAHALDVGVELLALGNERLELSAVGPHVLHRAPARAHVQPRVVHELDVLRGDASEAVAARADVARHETEAREASDGGGRRRACARIARSRAPSASSPSQPSPGAAGAAAAGARGAAPAR